MHSETPPRVLYPRPEKIEWRDGEFVLPANLSVRFFTDSDAPFLAEGFQDLWNRFTLGTGKAHLSRTGGPCGFAIMRGKHVPVLPNLKAGDTYALRVDKNGIAARGVDTNSLQHAEMTLMQMIQPRCLDRGQEQFAIPHVELADRPALPFRGLHLCVFPETRLPFLEKMMRLAGLLKYSHVVLEFWGMLKLESFPLLAWPQAYSKDEVKPIIDAAGRMGLEVVPMFNHWGHAAASRACYGRHVVLDQDPSQALLFEPDGWTWCLSNPDSLKIFADIRNELEEFCGAGSYFHLGCDEAYSHATCDLCRRKDSVSLLGEFLNAVSSELSNRGRRAIVWGDALLDSEKWERPTVAKSRPDQCTHEVLSMLSRDIVIADWQYSITEGPVPSFAHFKERGFDVLLSPWHDPANIKALGETAQKENGLGVLQTTWHTLPEHPLLLPMGAMAGWCDRKRFEHSLAKGSAFARATMAAFLRKLVPVEGDFKRAGWNSFETTG